MAVLFISFRKNNFQTKYVYLLGNGVEFCLNFRALFYLILPAIMVKMAARNNWRGVYTDLIPHCMTLSWWQMALVASQGTLYIIKNIIN